MSSDKTLTKESASDEKIEISSVASWNNFEHSAAEERRLVRKLDGRILPIACLLYLFAFLDRSNLGNARLQGLPADILGGDKSGKLFDWINSAFYFSYIICPVPATVLSKLVPPRLWLAGAAIGWGVVSTLMATSFSFGSIMSARVILGIFESGFGPAIPLYFSLYYTKEEMGQRMACWFGFAAVAGAFGGLLAFGVQHIHSLVQTWRLLFIIEGIPPIALGIATLFLLPDRPESTTFLTERERKLAIDRMNRSTSGDKGAVVQKAHVYAAFCDWRIYTGGLIYFALNNALSALSAFLPTIITTFGFTNVRAQLLTVPPYAVAAVVLASFSYASDRLQTRGIFMCIACTLGGIGYLLLLVVENSIHVRYFAIFCIVSGTYTTIGIIIAWYAHNLGSETKKAAGIPLFMAVGQCGSILGSHLFPKTEEPRYIQGFAVSCALMFLAALLTIMLSISYRRENARRDELHGIPEPNVKVDTRELADKAPTFRYVV